VLFSFCDLGSTKTSTTVFSEDMDRMVLYSVLPLTPYSGYNKQEGDEYSIRITGTSTNSFY
jgi:hypothetical protein